MANQIGMTLGSVYNRSQGIGHSFLGIVSIDDMFEVKRTGSTGFILFGSPTFRLAIERPKDR